MRTEDVVKHFNGRMGAARALGLSKAAVYKWREFVPELSARRLHQITHGKLRFDPALYPIPSRDSHVA